MELKVSVVITKGQEDKALDFVSEAMTSSRPPISKEASGKIRQIRESRLASLTGSDRYEAALMFDALDTMAPVHGETAVVLFPALIKTGMSLDKAGELLRKEKTDNCNKGSRDEWGFFSTTGEVFLGDKSMGRSGVMLDMHRADGVSGEPLVLIYKSLCMVSDRELRKALVDDLCKIAALRMEFEMPE